MKFLNDMANKYNASAIDCRNAFGMDDVDGRLSERQTIGHEDFARVVIASVVSSIAGAIRSTSASMKTGTSGVGSAGLRRST